MPVVPHARQQVETRPIPGASINPRAPESAFATRPGLDLRGVQQFVEQERAKADQVTVLDADNRLAETQLELHQAALAKRGRDAMGATAETRDAWDQATSEIGGGITSERAQLAFRQRASSRWSSLHASVEEHASSEAQKYDVEQTTVALTNRHNDALTHYQEPERVEGALRESEAILRDFGKRQGLPPDVIDEKVAAARSAAHVGILDRMLSNGQDRTATAYFTEHKAEIEGDKLAGVEKALEVGSTLGQGQRNADAILFGAKPASSRREAYDRARLIADPKERQATEQRLDTEYARQDRDQRDQYDALLERASRAVAGGELPAPGIMSQLKVGHQAQMRAAVKRQAAGTPVHTDAATLYQLMNEAGSTDPATRQKFASRNLVDFLDKLSTSDFEQLTRQQLAIKAGKPVGPEFKGFVTTSTMLNQAIKGTKLKPGSPEFTDLQTKVLEAQQQMLEGTGRKTLTPEQTQQLIDRVVVSHFYVDQVGPDPAFRGAQLEKLDADQRGRLYVPLKEIPPGELAALRANAKKLGNADPLERDLERAWAATLIGDGAALARALKGTR